MSGGAQKHAAAVDVECIVPILRVSSLPSSLRYYVEALGFRVDWGDQDGAGMASVSRGGHAIMLCEGAQGQPGTWIWIGVEDIAPLYAAYRSKGARFLQPPSDRPWAYEMQLLDPDGHVLRFGSEPRDPGVPRLV
jgi:catechol 2,3-dioxygenase-like lactoylglutathione lyase family enzyme